MIQRLIQLHILCVAVVFVSTDPDPGRVPKVYNALITSNQNLEPSKAFPVYQPVLHDPTFGFPYPSIYYGDFYSGNGILPPLPLAPKAPNPPQPPPESTDDKDKPLSTEETPSEPSEKPSDEGKEPSNKDEDKPIGQSPHPPPSTESPIPLNHFGLPPQVLPLGRINPAYNGYTQVGPFTYTYPSIDYRSYRFYDPYDPYNINPYLSFPPPLFRPYGNVLDQNIPLPKPSPAAAPESPPEDEKQSPPSEPSDLNILNNAGRDPSIPNVPPPPLTEGGIKSDKSD